MSVSAFYAGVTSPSVGAATEKIHFNLINISALNTPYNMSSDTFSVSQRSLYWFHICAGIPTSSKTNYRLNGLVYPAVVYSSATGYPQDQLTADTLQWVWPNATLSISNNQSLRSSSELETAWLGFRLDNLFNPLVAFGVQLTQTFNSISSVKFDRILVNEGNRYNLSDGSFIVPLSGIYFFSMVTTKLFYLKVNGVLKLCTCVCDNAHNSGDLVSSRGSAMFALNANDKVQVVAVSGFLPIYTTQDGLVNFQGFLYSPISGNQVAWSVVRSASVEGPADYVSFDIINTNKPTNCWIIASNKISVPLTGLYFVDIYAYLCGSSFAYCAGNGDTSIQVLRNGVPIVSIRMAIATFDNCASRSRSIIVALNVSDELRVRVPTGGCLYSDSQQMMAFNGFLMH